MIALNFTLILEAALFLVFLGGAYHLAWRPLLQTMDARNETIERDKISAEKSRKEVQRLEERYRHQLMEIHQEAAHALNQARYDAYQKGREELDALRQEADREVEACREAIDAQIEEERRRMQPFLEQLVEAADLRINAEGSLL